MRDKIIDLLDNPQGRLGTAYVLTSLLLIYLSIGLLVFEWKYPEHAENYQLPLYACNLLVLMFFALDLAARLIFYRKRLQYLVSPYGIVDIITVLPGLLGVIFPRLESMSWLRVFRVVRLARLITLTRFSKQKKEVNDIFGGVLSKLFPWLAAAIGFKAVVIPFEGRPFWPDPGALDVTLGVSGFAITVLLGAKLAIVLGRFYALEDSICKIVGYLEFFSSRPQDRHALYWGQAFWSALSKPDSLKFSSVKTETRTLSKALISQNIEDGTISDFLKEVEYSIHHIEARTPHYFDQFLMYVTIVFGALSIFAVPGFTGFLSVAVIVFVLGGMYVLIDDLDCPLGNGARSLINIDLSPLLEFLIRTSPESLVEAFNDRPD